MSANFDKDSSETERVVCFATNGQLDGRTNGHGNGQMCRQTWLDRFSTQFTELFYTLKCVLKHFFVALTIWRFVCCPAFLSVQLRPYRKAAGADNIRREKF